MYETPILVGSMLVAALMALLKWKYRRAERRISKGLRAYASGVQVLS